MPEISTSQDILPAVSEDEKRDILAKQEIEIGWWKNAVAMETAEDIKAQVEKGFAAAVPDQGIGYQLSPAVKPEFKVLEANTKSLLEEVAQRWVEILKQRGINSEGAYLRITSLARTSKFQQELIAKGYPAAPDSTHTKLGAFDILISWFRDNRPDLLEALTEALAQTTKNNRANCIEEPEIGVIHVAFNRTSIM